MNADQQSLRLANERFVIPELLFHPSDVGIRQVTVAYLLIARLPSWLRPQMGIPEAVMESIRACPPETVPHIFPNIVVVGGCALFPGMQTRMEMEIRALAPDDVSVKVTVPAE